MMRVWGQSTWQRVAVLALLLVLIAFSFGPAASPLPMTPERPEIVSDTVLYRHIVERMGDGTGYYAAVALEHRAHGFPLKPFLTVRLPSMSWINVSGDPQVMLWALLLLTAIAWAAVPELHLWERPVVSLLIVAGGWQALAEPGAWIHEIWASLLLAMSIAIYRRRKWWFAIIPALAAVMMREFALPFLLLAGTLALYDGRRQEAAAWAGATLIFALFIVAHSVEVSRIVLPDDKGSPGWLGLLGYPEVVQRIAKLTPFAILPHQIMNTVVVISCFGWLGLRNWRGVFVFLFLTGMTVFLATFPRYDNAFWPLIITPLWLAGLTFVPRLGRWLIGEPEKPLLIL